MTSILTITLNPTVDLSTRTDAVLPDRKLRCAAVTEDPGGGGVNITRAIRAMDGHSAAFVAVGGPTGDKVIHLLSAQAIPLMLFPAPGETRQSMAVSDATGAQFRFVMPGPVWAEADVTGVLARIVQAAVPQGIVVLSGSQPPGVPDDFPARLATALEGTQARLFVDTSGPALHRLMRAEHRPVDVLRMDDLEAEELAGRRLETRAESALFAQSLVLRGLAEAVIVARGADGNVLATANRTWVAEAAPVEVVSKVGAGDSFVAGFTLALSRGAELPQALQHGAAAASAAVMTPATDLCRGADVAALLPACPVTEL